MSDSGTDAAMDEEGNRIIKIQLPSGKTVGATVDPSLKMMDLVISIATNNRLPPTAYQIAQPSKHRGRPPVIYTPSQSVADIEGSTIMLIPKKEKEQFSINKGQVKKSGIFEHTVRLTIYSGKSHKMTFRTNPEKRLEEVFGPICNERGVDPSRHVMRAHKQKVDADMTQPISGFGTLEFDLLEKVFADNDSKRKSILFGRLKKKEDEEELQKTVQPVTSVPTAVNGSHLRTATAPERNLQKQISAEGARKLQTQNSAEGGLKKRPAPPPPTSAPVQQGASPPATGTQAPGSQSTLNRSATKKRRAPPVPTAAVAVNSGQDEVDVTQQDRSSEGYPPSSPSASQHSSLGASDRDTSVSGSIGERDGPGSPPPPKPPRYSYQSEDETNPPIFIPPSPPPTLPSATFPPEDVEKFIAEGLLLSAVEDVDEADGGSTPREDTHPSSDEEGEGSIRSSSTGTSRSDDNREANRSELEAPVGAPRVMESPPPPYVEQMPPPPMPQPPISNNAGRDAASGENNGASGPKPKRVCKCYDPENGEDCDCRAPGAVLKSGFVYGLPSVQREGDVDDFPPPPPPDDFLLPPDYQPPPTDDGSPDANCPDVILNEVGQSAGHEEQLKSGGMPAGAKRPDGPSFLTEHKSATGKENTVSPQGPLTIDSGTKPAVPPRKPRKLPKPKQVAAVLPAVASSPSVSETAGGSPNEDSSKPVNTSMTEESKSVQTMRIVDQSEATPPLGSRPSDEASTKDNPESVTLSKKRNSASVEPEQFVIQPEISLTLESQSPEETAPNYPREDDTKPATPLGNENSKSFKLEQSDIQPEMSPTLNGQPLEENKPESSSNHKAELGIIPESKNPGTMELLQSDIQPEMSPTLNSQPVDENIPELSIDHRAKPGIISENENSETVEPDQSAIRPDVSPEIISQPPMGKRQESLTEGSSNPASSSDSEYEDSESMCTSDSNTYPTSFEPLVAPTHAKTAKVLQREGSLESESDMVRLVGFDMGERILETTSYSPPPQDDEDLGTMEEKSVKFSGAVSVVAEESVPVQAVKADKDEVKTELVTGDDKDEQGGKAANESSSDKRGGTEEQMPADLKDMYVQMQKQLAELQQTMLAQQQSTNQATAAQPPAANQGGPQQQSTNQMSSPQQSSVDQTALLQLQQLQQQMLLQQQLLMQQGMLPRTGMMMPPLMMQPTHPMMQPTPPMMVQMTPQMTTQGVMMQPYMLPPQQQMVMVSPPSQMAQGTANKETSETVPASSPDSAQTTLEDTGRTSPVAAGETSTTYVAQTILSATKQESDSKDIDRTHEKALDKTHVQKEETHTESTSSGVQTASPSSRRKDVFADILKKKGKPKTNYVLSAQREMSNRRNSGATLEAHSTNSWKKEHVETSLSSQGQEHGSDHSKSSDESARNLDAGSKNQLPQSGGTSDNEDQNLEKVIQPAINKEVEVETLVQSVQSPTLKSAPSASSTHQPIAGTNSESPPAEGQELPQKLDSASSVVPSPQVELKQSLPQSKAESPSHDDKERTLRSEPNMTNNNNVIIRENGDVKGGVKVTQVEARFAGESSREDIAEVSSRGDAPADSSTSEAAKPPPPKVPPRPRQGPRPFNKTRRPVSLASDSQGELQQLTSLSNVSRFREVGFNPGARKPPSNEVRSYMEGINKQMKNRRGQSHVYEKQGILKKVLGGVGRVGGKADKKEGKGKHREEDMYSDEWDTDWDSDSDEHAN